jgi:hypothetical protein
MSFLIHNTTPSTERLVRTLFWTLWVLTVVFTAYALAVESFGVGLFLEKDVPRRYMLGEAQMAGGLGSLAAIGLAVVCAFIRSWSGPLFRLGIATLALWVVYLTIER